MTRDDTASQQQSTQDTIPLFVAIAFVVGIFTGWLGDLVGLVLAYFKRGELAGTWGESVLTYFIRTFWISFFGALIGVLLIFVFIGLPLLLVVWLWHLIRTVRGALAAFEKKPIPNPKTWWF